MKVWKIAAFSNSGVGGNPAGVVVAKILPSAPVMQKIAADVGFSETVFAARAPNGESYRTRYFSPETEVPFCGHATIALGAVLGRMYGPKVYPLTLNNAEISVESWVEEDTMQVALQSPSTHSKKLDEQSVSDLLTLFSLAPSDLDERLSPARIHGGSDHLFLAVNDRRTLTRLSYDLQRGKAFMHTQKVATIMLVYARDDQSFDVRNAFASAGVFEDPATGAAASAFSGYLRDIGWPHQGQIHITQGEDMGMKSLITAQIPSEKGTSIRISGSAREMG
ncbi:PhzF family phenazine biosynthesis protein [Flexibacterium corallicola]|uniref:PhzF family phenazine biosynthesis protein n=1 Tax=Flexibacterium corallicola TaxID=3037259 RepID=UPI00286EDC63|nr:PhzF family phenazine biosynthesis protein [Pseudovibrio sp. M1P-2-3]